MKIITEVNCFEIHIKSNFMKQVILILSILALTISCSTNEKQVAGKKILIYTRNSPEGYIHDNIAASVKALEEICSDLGIVTEATDSPYVFTAEKLKEFDGIIFSNSNNQAFTSEDQRLVV